MKKLFTAALAAISTLTFGATLNPVSLLNPAGSTAGQAILSTGPSSAPAWGAISLSTLTGIVPVTNGGTGASTATGARTNLGLGTAAMINTGTSGATIPLLNGTNTWAAAQSFTADLVRGGAAGTSRGVQFFSGSNLRWYQFVDSVAEGGSNGGSNWNLSRYSDAGGFLDTPLSILRSSGAVTIKGSQTNDAAAAGFVGEYVSNSATGVSLTSGAITNISSISLTAGDWDVQGEVDFVPAGTTVMTLQFASVNTSATTNGPMGQRTSINGSQTAGAGSNLTTPTWRVSLAATTTIYVNALGNFTTSTATANGFIRARRIR